MSATRRVLRMIAAAGNCRRVNTKGTLVGLVFGRVLLQAISRANLPFGRHGVTTSAVGPKRVRTHLNAALVREPHSEGGFGQLDKRGRGHDGHVRDIREDNGGEENRGNEERRRDSPSPCSSSV
jgi:hypothetical protein